MTARYDIPPADTPRALSAVRPGMVTALALALVGAVLAGVAPVLGIVSPTTPPGFPSWPLLVVLAVLPAVVAVLALRRQRPVIAAAVLMGPAVLVPGRLILDVQITTDASLAARPELFVPHTIAPLVPATGLWLLLAAELATFLAGVVAMRSTRQDAVADGENYWGQVGPVGGARKQRLLALVLCASVLGTVSVLMRQLRSDTPFLLARAAVDSPPLVLGGSLLLAVAIPSFAGYVVSSADAELARGGLLGLALALLAVVAPPLTAATVVSDLHYSAGAVLGLLAAVTMAGLAIPAGQARGGEVIGEFQLPVLNRMLMASGGLALAAGALTLLATVTPEVSMPPGLPDPSAYPAEMLWPAGIVLVVLGVGLLVPRTARLVRPALPVAWTVAPLAVASVLDAVLTATQLAGATAGIGAWSAGIAVLLALLSAGGAVVAGAIERDDVDLTRITVDRVLLVPALVAVVLDVGAFSLPVVSAPGYSPPGVFTEFGTASWGLVLAMLGVLAAAVLAPLCRPARAAGLLCAGAAVLLTRVLELPLTIGRIEGMAPDLGLWSAAAGLLTLLVTAGLALRGKPAS